MFFIFIFVLSLSVFAQTESLKISTVLTMGKVDIEDDAYLATDTGKNVGIGTTKPAAKLHINEPNGNGLVDVLWLSGTDAGSFGNGARIVFNTSYRQFPTWRIGEIGALYDGGGMYGGDMVFRTNTGTDYTDVSEKMRIKANGNVGIGTMSPEFKLSLDGDGGIIAKGTYESGNSLTPSGSGARLIWYPRKAAFRAGYVIEDIPETPADEDARWDDDNIGTCSIAMGVATMASGSSSTAMGGGNVASGNYSTAMGSGSLASGAYSIVMGNGSVAIGDYSTAIGKAIVANGTQSVVIGKGAISAEGSIDADGFLNNDIADSLMVGFYSNIPTLFVGPSSGKWTTGKVGIGTTNPQYKLDVNGSAAISGQFDVNGSVAISGQVRLGTLNEISHSLNLHLDGGPSKWAGLAINNSLQEWQLQMNNATSGKLWLHAVNVGDIMSFDPDGLKVGIGTWSPNYKLDVRGSIGNNTTLYHSDIRWKKNVQPVSNALEKLLRLRGVNFQWKREEFKDMNFDSGQHIGLIAQEVEQVVPQVVTTNKDGYKTVEYANLVALLIESIKEQEKRIKALESRE